MNFTVVQGNTAAQSVDALVDAVGTSLRVGLGVAGALRRDDDPELNEAAMAKGLIDLGTVAVTDAFDLDAEIVAHATAIPHDGSEQATAASTRDAVLVPVFCEDGVRERGEIDWLLGDVCDAVGMTRPFYVKSELPARLLGRDVSADTWVACENCNNCAVLQAADAPGVCRTPAVLTRAGALRMEGAHDIGAETANADEADPEG